MSLIAFVYLFSIFVFSLQFHNQFTKERKEYFDGERRRKGQARAGRTCDRLGVLDRRGNRRRVRSSNIRLDGCVDGVASERRTDCCWR